VGAVGGLVGAVGGLGGFYLPLLGRSITVSTNVTAHQLLPLVAIAFLTACVALVAQRQPVVETVAAK